MFGHVSNSTELVRMCLACQHFVFNSADWISIICMRCPADICDQWERNLSFGSADVSGAGTRDEPLRTSAWEATGARAYRSDSVRHAAGNEVFNYKGSHK